MADYFDDLLTAILDADRDLNPSRLSELSDPTRVHLKVFREAWFETPAPRRREISQHLYELARENIELLFERINRVLLEDPDPVVRKQAIDNLWEAEGKDLAITLARMANEDPDLEVRRRAAEALSRFIYLSEMEKIPADVRDHIEATLLQMLEKSSSRNLQRQALESLGYSSHIDLREKIHASYESGNEEDLRSSLVAMGRSADPGWREKIEA
ncbi:MAG: HEAT repeat domain-containing protein, partial [Anaerolineales bacterium]